MIAELREGRSQRWLGAGTIPPPKRITRRLGRSGLQAVLLTSLNGEQLDGTIADYCRVTEGLESGDMVEAEAITRPGLAPRAIALEMD